MYLVRKDELRALWFDVAYWRRERHFTWPSEPRKGLAICRAKVVP